MNRLLAGRRRPPVAIRGGRLCALLGALLLTGACGQKGALYLPDPAPLAVPAPSGKATPDATSATAPTVAPPATPADDPTAQRKTPGTPDPATAR